MTRQIIDYQIILATDTVDLESYVKAAIKNGWQPIGGPYSTGTGWDAQAMVQYADPPAWVRAPGYNAEQSPDFTKDMIRRILHQPGSIITHAPPPAPIAPAPGGAHGWPAPDRPYSTPDENNAEQGWNKE